MNARYITNIVVVAIAITLVIGCKKSDAPESVEKKYLILAAQLSDIAKAPTKPLGKYIHISS